MKKYRWLCHECGTVQSRTMQQIADDEYGKPNCCRHTMKLLKDQSPIMNHSEALEIIVKVARDKLHEVADQSKDNVDDNRVLQRYFKALEMVGELAEVLEEFSDLADTFENLRFGIN